MAPAFAFDIDVRCTKCGRDRDVVLDEPGQARLAPIQDADAQATLRYTTAAACLCGARLVKATFEIGGAE